MKVLADDLAGLANSLKLEKPLFLGHSMGAITVLTLAGLYPQLPSAILLEDPPAFWCITSSEMAERQAHNGFKGWILSNKRKTFADLTAEAKSNPKWQEAEIEPWVNSKHRYDPGISEMISLPDLMELNYPVLMKNVNCPVLFLQADTQKGAASKDEDVEKLKEMIPQLQIKAFEGAGHNIRRESFEAYMKTVKEFLSRL
jgi:N-formylmaleamate deformylase